MAQFSHVAWPGIALEPRPGLGAQLFGNQPMCLGVLPQKRLCEDKHILPPIAQGRYVQEYDRQTMIQIGAEVPLAHARVQIRLGGGDELDIHEVFSHRSQTPYALFLDSLEELVLQRQGEGIDLVQEQGTSRRRLEEAWLGTSGISERAGFEAKQLCLQQGLRDGGA